MIDVTKFTNEELAKATDDEAGNYEFALCFNAAAVLHEAARRLRAMDEPVEITESMIGSLIYEAGIVQSPFYINRAASGCRAIIEALGRKVKA